MQYRARGWGEADTTKNTIGIPVYGESKNCGSTLAYILQVLHNNGAGTYAEGETNDEVAFDRISANGESHIVNLTPTVQWEIPLGAPMVQWYMIKVNTNGASDHTTGNGIGAVAYTTPMVLGHMT